MLFPVFVNYSCHKPCVVVIIIIIHNIIFGVYVVVLLCVYIMH